uniref:Uncharacterized protein n=1 Tax=Glossina brevipalpis TaxID=37001 RepID=A0A1A9WFD7_9MUSC
MGIVLVLVKQGRAGQGRTNVLPMLGLIVSEKPEEKFRYLFISIVDIIYQILIGYSFENLFQTITIITINGYFDNVMRFVPVVDFVTLHFKYDHITTDVKIKSFRALVTRALGSGHFAMLRHEIFISFTIKNYTLHYKSNGKWVMGSTKNNGVVVAVVVIVAVVIVVAIAVAL